ncbi:HNH endonuclease (fragment) (plasmid) [Cupriavidus taiwanensis]|uniref:HNH endonuclease n=1 Tax=Cupriavidus taiwanensis TaxID=164546 RepID=A0A375EF34_9BURK
MLCCQASPDSRHPGFGALASNSDGLCPRHLDMSLVWDRSNWLAMRKPYHNRKTARFDVGFGRRRRKL